MCISQKFSLDDGGEKVNVQFNRSLIESLLYLTNSKPDILQATSLMNKFMESPSKHHLGAAKRILTNLTPN